MTATDMLQLFPTLTANPKLKAAKTVLSTVFAQRDGFYINELMLFVVHFNTIPNFINEIITVR